jgi:hypothetical protein
MYILIALLVGVVLGLRFRVLVLVPVTFFVVCIGGASFLLEPTWQTFWTMAAVIATLQVGFLLSLGAHRLWQYHAQQRQIAQGNWRRV